MGKIQILFLLLVLAGSGSTKAKEEKDGTELPLTFEAAVDKIIASLNEEDKKTVKETSFSDLIRYHHGWGTGIRNSYELWGGNTELLKSSCGSVHCHPDSASMEIIYGVWNILNGNDYRFKPNE